MNFDQVSTFFKQQILIYAYINFNICQIKMLDFV